MTHFEKPALIVITGPTATGKTRLAATVAARLDGEVISADSRQVYRGMDIGSGKDLGDFTVDGQQIPYHLIDIAEPGEEYNVFAFQQDFIASFEDTLQRSRQPVLCGGTGMYVEAAISGYRLLKVPENNALRHALESSDMLELTQMLRKSKALHNITDTTDKARLIRAIEIAKYELEHQDEMMDYPAFEPRVYAIHFDRSTIRQRITERLKQRLDAGMVAEVERLLKGGLTPGQLIFYGLEYRYLTQYVIGRISYEAMFEKLNTAIHQFAKRQMTWFRRMERKGLHIHWIDGSLPLEKKTEVIIQSATLR
jgi:tRNA dimethylallyltransferase